MRGLATVIFVGFVSMILFGIVAPTILEPLVETLIDSQAVQNSQTDYTWCFAESSDITLTNLSNSSFVRSLDTAGSGQ